MANVQHSSKTAEHYTPPDYMAAALALMQVIELDPASSPIANTIVGAKKIFTIEDNGLKQTWRGRTWLNPPGGIGESGESLPRKWWKKLVASYEADTVECALFLGFSLELLHRLQRDENGKRATYRLPLEFAMLVPEARIRFWHEENGALVAGKQPTHANFLVWLPPPWDQDGEKFASHFQKFGSLRR